MHFPIPASPSIGSNLPILFAILIVFGALLGRASLLEYTDLIDPTESRYASVASAMVASGDWLTPQIPVRGTMEPYLGKPPLHFWITAMSYSLFGVDEWTARLPSFIGFVFLTWLCFSCARRLFGVDCGVIAALIFCTSALAFFLGGGSVIDVTFTVFLSLATVSWFRFITEAAPGRSLALLAAVFAGLAVLCKGPLGIVLIALPTLLWSLIMWDFSWIRRTPWIWCTVMLLGVIAPWFIASEIKHPGFLNYFIWNENIARYLFKEYGDRYGSGHVFIYGMSWVMLFASFLPWALVTILPLFWLGPRESWKAVRGDRKIAFIFCWALAPVLLFTFVRQLHAMYLLPCIPGAAILTALIITRAEGKVSARIGWIIGSQGLLIFFLTLGLIMLVGGSIYGVTVAHSVLCLLLIVSIVAIISLLRNQPSMVTAVSRAAASLAALYLLAIVTATPHVNLSRSGEKILQRIAQTIPAGAPSQTIGTTSSRAYSLYWASWAWEEELGRELEIDYLDKNDLMTTNLPQIIIDADKELPSELSNRFEFFETLGDWTIYRRKVV